MGQNVDRRIGETEPLIMEVSAVGLDDLADSVQRLAYFYRQSDGGVEVDGVACPIVSGRQISLDPVDAKAGGGTAFQTEDVYVGHVVITMSDGDVNVYPQDAREDVRVRVR